MNIERNYTMGDKGGKKDKNKGQKQKKSKEEQKAKKKLDKQPKKTTEKNTVIGSRVLIHQNNIRNNRFLGVTNLLSTFL